jgi:hypothetical protein
MSAILKSKQTSCSQDNPQLFIFGLPKKGRFVTQQAEGRKGRGLHHSQVCCCPARDWGTAATALHFSHRGYRGHEHLHMQQHPGVLALPRSLLTLLMTRDLIRREASKLENWKKKKITMSLH